MAYPGHHTDASEGYGKFFGFSETQRRLTNAVGENYAATVQSILKNTKSGPGEQIYEFKQMLKTIKENLIKKMEETGKMNGGIFIEAALQNLLLEAMPIIERANTQIENIKPKPITVNTKVGRKEGESSKDENAEEKTSDIVPQSGAGTPNTTQQSGGTGLFVMHAPTSSLGGQVKMGIMNSLGSNAHAMCTPTPMCLVHGNAHAWPGAQAPCFDAACGPWPSALSNAQAAGCAQPLCYVLAQ